MEQSLKGIVPPLVTPLLDNDRLDIKGLERLIEHVISGGVHGIFILGTTGEAQSLSFDLRAETIKRAGCILKSRLPLLVGISDTSVGDSVKLAKIAAENGADALVSAPPYYYTSGQPELIEFYEYLIPQLPLPIYLYNIPVHTKVLFSPLTVLQISNNEKVIGFKDSSGSGSYFQSVMYAMREKKEFSIFVGPEEMMAESVLLGASGGVSGGANLFPKLYVDLYEAAVAKDIEKVQDLQSKVLQICASIYNVGSYDSSYLKGLKCSLNILGICSDFLASPFNKFGKEHRIRIEKALNEIRL
jgi:4-hydroxy-tetrahydrodipicolinate synthase